MNTNCPKCGRPLREGMQFCTNCGARTMGARGSLGDSVPTAEAAASNPTIVQSDALLGRVLDGKYEIVAPLGEGGMGAVYRARRVHIGDEVAVKVLHPKYVNDETLLERFRREARAAAQLHHPNVVTIHDYGEAGGREGFAYIVMELVRGESLRGLLLSEGKLSAARAVSLMRDVCAGVGSAHRRGIVHRDLKPDNIIVLPADDDHDRERVKVVDFGIAKLRDMASDSTLTQAGAVVGTPYYMSPEQCRGEPLDARADVYSLGAMLYEMLAGAPPFTAPSVTGVIARHLTEAPPRLPEALGVPTALQEAVMRSLAKDPEARQKDAADFAREIQSAAETRPAEESKPAAAVVQSPATPPPFDSTGQRPAPVVPLQQPPTQPPRPPVPTAHGHTPTPTDPNQFAPGTHGQQQHTQGQPPPHAQQQTHNQQPLHQPPAHQQPPPHQHAAPPPRKKSRAPLVVGLVVLSLLVVSVLGIVGLVYLGSGGSGGGTASNTNANRAGWRTTETNTGSTSKSEITSADPKIAEAMRRAEMKIISDTRLTREDLAPLTPVELRLLRNALFARHGRVFQDADLRTYFGSRKWYEPNKGFTEAMLTATDRANAELIKSVESGGSAPADDATPPADAAEIKNDIAVTLEAWAATTRAKLLDLHMIYYADTLDTYYRRSNVPASLVRADRARAFERYDDMDVQLSDVKITPDSDGTRATVTFDKTWEFDAADKTSTGSVRQQLTLTRVEGRWLITGEKDLQIHYSNSTDDGAKN